MKTADDIVKKSDDAKGETATSKVNKLAGDSAKKAQKTEQKHDAINNIFTK
jgi:hypothetical protein